MKFRIIHEPTGDSICIEGNTIDEIREKAYAEEAKRGWKEDDMYSEEL